MKLVVFIYGGHVCMLACIRYTIIVFILNIYIYIYVEFLILRG